MYIHTYIRTCVRMYVCIVCTHNMCVLTTHIRIIHTRVSYVSVRNEMFLERSLRRFTAMAMSTSAVAFPVCVAALF